MTRQQQAVIGHIFLLARKTETWCITLAALIVLILATGCASRMETRICSEERIVAPTGQAIVKQACQVVVQDKS